MRDTKQVIVIRRDLRMRRGKEIAQGAHAAMSFLTKPVYDGQEPMALIRHDVPPKPEKDYDIYSMALNPATLNWIKNGFRKITCQVDTEEDLRAIKALADDEGVICHVIEDNGTTEFHGEPTITCLAIGPDWSDKVDKVTKDLKLY